MQEKVLLTKLQLPPPRPNLVHRQRLIEHLNEGLSEGKALTLVSAPAGYGKSVLIAEWLRSLLRQEHNGNESHSTYDACWISLELSDSDPARFLSYLNSAIRDSNADIVFEIRSIDDWVNFTAVEWLLTDIINCLSSQNQPPLIIVLDDYHQISNPVIHRMIQFLIDHRPPQLHLVILTREDPPLPLSRFRANAEMTELRAEELRFNHEEAAAFISQTMHLSLETESIHSLTKRTEGWIAGLQLAALSLRQKSNAEAEIGQFLGSNRYLVDYLMDEVIKTQPDDIKDFLSKTALLKRFTPKLCDLITDRNDSVSILKLFEQANLFLIPLDDECAWYRYHHLFSDCLRKMLPVHDPIQLYGKAVHYCLKYELLEEAADYALASKDLNLAANTIESVMNNPQVWSSGQLNMLEGWLKAIPDACFANRPGLQVAAARAYSLAGRFEQAELLLERAEQALMVRAQEGQTNSDQNINLAQTGIYRAAIMAVGGHLEAASRQIAQARIHLPPDNKHVEARALVTMAMIEEQTGHLVQAEGHYLEAAACAMTAGVTYLAVNALCETAIVRQVQGRLTDAEQICRDALQLGKMDNGYIPPTGLAWAIWGDILRERNLLDQADQYIQTGVNLASEGGLVDDLQHALIYQARIKLALGDFEVARQTMRRSILMMRAYRVTRLTALSQALEARMALALGNVAEASSWANNVKNEVLMSTSYSFEREKLTVARVWLTESKLSEAQELLQKVSKVAREEKRDGTLLEALIMLALIKWQFKDVQETCKVISESIRLAMPQGYVRIFIDEGEALRQILEACKNDETVTQYRLYIEQILNAYAPSPEGTPVGLLSPQENRILGLLAEGASNQTIASTLFISVGTVKWHVHNIYEKLGVNSRTQAINRGRDLNFIK